MDAFEKQVLKLQHRTTQLTEEKEESVRTSQLVTEKQEKIEVIQSQFETYKLQSEDEVATLDARIVKMDKILDDKNRIIKGLKVENKFLIERNRALEDQSGRTNNEMRDRFNAEKRTDLEDQRKQLQTLHLQDKQKAINDVQTDHMQEVEAIKTQHATEIDGVRQDLARARVDTEN